MLDRLNTLIKHMQTSRVIFIGDMVADVYLEGRASRISREAPVLILEHQGEVVIPGGAANAVHNAATLGGNIQAFGILGDDFAGAELKRILGDKGVNISGLLSDVSRPTISKTRVMAGGQATVRQQVIRIDRGWDQPIGNDLENILLELLQERLDQANVVVFSDYGSGTITPRIRTEVIRQCRRRQIPTVVDSRYDIKEYFGVALVKQNEAEAAAAVGLKELTKVNIETAGKELLGSLDAEAVLITRGPEGMTLFPKSGERVDIPVTNKSEVYDVTGAGDTVVAVMALAMGAGANVQDAALLANVAAGVVVRKPGTATTSPVELQKALRSYHETC